MRATAAFVLCALVACGGRTTLGTRDLEDAAIPDASTPDAAIPDAAPSKDAAKSCAFDRGAAAVVLIQIANNLGHCATPSGPSGPGKVKIPFEGTYGSAHDVTFVEGAFGGTAVGDCILADFATAHVPPFCGPDVPANKSFVLPK